MSHNILNIENTFKIAIRMMATLVFFIFASSRMAAQVTTDSTFLAESWPVIFKVNKTIIRPEYRKMLIDTVVPRLQNLKANEFIIGRSAASPEGPFWNNVRLANGRRDVVFSLLQEHGIKTSLINFDTEVEEYDLLLEMMRQANDADYQTVKDMVDKYYPNYQVLKHKMKIYRYGSLWKRLLKEYFPQLRATRLRIYGVPMPDVHISYDDTMMRNQPNRDFIAGIPGLKIDRFDADVRSEGSDDSGDDDDNWFTKFPRREMLSIKTNLLEWGAYVPQYGYCPMPNVAIEYYPLHGHFTYGAAFDCPWWIGNTSNHKYFELRNYTLEGRYYTRSGDRSYAEGGAAFKGFYMSAYTNAFLYQIGFSASKGWVGEGLGAGIGLGYVMPISRNEHWRLEFGAQLGFFWTKYDPFVYGCPVENVEDGLYYYNYTGDADLFKTRQHRFTWLGPTRVGISLTYDLLYRRRKEVQHEY